MQKLNRRILFKEKTVADGVAGVNQQSDAQRQVCLRREIHDLPGRFVIVQNLELIFFQVFDELIVLVRDSKNHVHFV